jgi:hypothetical protein
LAKKAEEFPGDEETAHLLGAAETNILLLRDELLVMTQSTEVSVREAEGITEIAESARAAEAYNRLFAEALPIARGGDQDSLDIYFGALLEQLREAERDYNWAVAEKKPEATQRGVELAEALVDYTAGLDVAYDVVDAADQETLLPEVVLIEDEEDALMFPIDAARSTEGGQSDVTFRLMQLYDSVIDAEFNLRSDSGDPELQTALARAREEYRYTKEYAVDTAAQQEGATPEEIAAAERAASGEVDDGIEEVAIDPDAAAELERQIAEQRAEEQRIKLELVAQAEAELEAAQAEADRLAAEEAEAAAAAAAAEAEKQQAEALFALIEANTQSQESGEAASSRRRLEGEARTDLTKEICNSEFLNATFNQDCIDFVVALKAAAVAKAQEAKEAKEAAEKAAKAAEEEASAKEDGVTEAWVTKVETEGPSVEEQITEKKKELALLSMKLSKNEDNSDLRKQVGQLKTSIKVMEASLVEAKAAEREANPAAAEAEAAALARAARLKEEAERLPDDVRQELIDRMTNVFSTGDTEKVKKLQADQEALVDAARLAKKTVAAKSTSSKEEIDAADTAFVLEQKKLRVLQQTLKMERDRAAEAVRKA